MKPIKPEVEGNFPMKGERRKKAECDEKWIFGRRRHVTGAQTHKWIQRLHVCVYVNVQQQFVSKLSASLFFLGRPYAARFESVRRFLMRPLHASERFLYRISHIFCRYPSLFRTYDFTLCLSEENFSFFVFLSHDEARLKRKTRGEMFCGINYTCFEIFQTNKGNFGRTIRRQYAYNYKCIRNVTSYVCFTGCR